MTEQHQFPSVADMMRKDRSPAEAQLIKPAWSVQGAFGRKVEGRARPH